jgi:hypothetical protein
MLSGQIRRAVRRRPFLAAIAPFCMFLPATAHAPLFD